MRMPFVLSSMRLTGRAAISVRIVGDLRVDGRFPAGDHDHVEPATLPREPGVDVGQHIRHSHEPRLIR